MLWQASASLQPQPGGAKGEAEYACGGRPPCAGGVAAPAEGIDPHVTPGGGGAGGGESGGEGGIACKGIYVAASGAQGAPCYRSWDELSASLLAEASDGRHAARTPAKGSEELEEAAAVNGLAVNCAAATSALAVCLPVGSPSTTPASSSAPATPFARSAAYASNLKARRSEFSVARASPLSSSTPSPVASRTDSRSPTPGPRVSRAAAAAAPNGKRGDARSRLSVSPPRAPGSRSALPFWAAPPSKAAPAAAPRRLSKSVTSDSSTSSAAAFTAVSSSLSSTSSSAASSPAAGPASTISGRAGSSPASNRVERYRELVQARTRLELSARLAQARAEARGGGAAAGADEAAARVSVSEVQTLHELIVAATLAQGHAAARAERLEGALNELRAERSRSEAAAEAARLEAQRVREALSEGRHRWAEALLAQKRRGACARAFAAWTIRARGDSRRSPAAGTPRSGAADASPSPADAAPGPCLIASPKPVRAHQKALDTPRTEQATPRSQQNTPEADLPEPPRWHIGGETEDGKDASLCRRILILDPRTDAAHREELADAAHQKDMGTWAAEVVECGPVAVWAEGAAGAEAVGQDSEAEVEQAAREPEGGFGVQSEMDMSREEQCWTSCGASAPDGGRAGEGGRTSRGPDSCADEAPDTWFVEAASGSALAVRSPSSASLSASPTGALVVSPAVRGSPSKTVSSGRAGPVAFSLCGLGIVVLLAFSQELLAYGVRFPSPDLGPSQLVQWPGGAPPKPDDPPSQRAWRKLARSGVHHPLLHAFTHRLDHAAPPAGGGGALHVLGRLKQRVFRRQPKDPSSRSAGAEECPDDYGAVGAGNFLLEAAVGSHGLMHEVCAKLEMQRARAAKEAEEIAAGVGEAAPDSGSL